MALTAALPWRLSISKPAKRAFSKLLPDDEDDSDTKAYDGRLTRRLLRYLNPYRTQTLWAVVFMSLALFCMWPALG